MRTPYDKNEYRSDGSDAYWWAGQGYAVAVQDVRGKYESFGIYTVNAADWRDGPDMVDWLVAQPWSTGKVGTFGCSYLGENQLLLARMRHPNHVAAIPQGAGGAYRWGGYLNGGAIELAAGFGWFRGAGSKINYHPPEGTPSSFYREAAALYHPAPTLPKIDYRAAWRIVPMLDMMKRTGSPPNDFTDWLTHERSDRWWDSFGYVRDTDRFAAPMLHVNSWFDPAVLETLEEYSIARKNAVTPAERDNQFVVISPTPHCESEGATEKTMVGTLDVGDARLDYYAIYLRWFDHWLKGVDNGVTRMAPVQLYVMGRNQWRAEHEWPLARTVWTKYYLQSDGRANSRMGSGRLDPVPPASEPADSFVSDPGGPVPTLGGPICCTAGQIAPGSLDQSESEMRHDVLVYTTAPLDRGVEVTGPLELVLTVSSSAKDTDFTGKLLDVFPDGRALNIQEGILRARYREGIDKKVWMEPGRSYELKVSLQATSYYFAPGHRIRLEVSSSNFPRFDRNFNTGGNTFDETSWRLATNVIHHTTGRLSYLILPVIP